MGKGMNNSIKKGVVVAVTLLFISVSVIPSTGTVVEKKYIKPTFYDGKTLYVGGSGPNNYTRIQDAINDSNDGDTVFVYNGTYNEFVEINKQITLQGENKYNTIVEGGGLPRFAVFHVFPAGATNVKISNFTIRNTPDYRGISLYSGNNTIINCILYNLHTGIYVYSDNNSIINCQCYNNYVGIGINTGNNNEISFCRCYLNNYLGISIENHGDNNKISNCNIYSNVGKGFSTGIGIFFGYANDNGITKCNISKNQIGIWLAKSDDNYIHWCDFYNNSVAGISARDSTVNNRIDGNNFIRNTINAEDYSNNSWGGWHLHGGNYWSDYTGNDYYRGINQDIPGSDGIGDTPYYYISGPGNNTDRYPLMSPYGCPFQPLYLGYVDVHFEKESILSGGGGYGGLIRGIYLNVNTSIEELPLTMVYHYTIEMNYSLRFPFWLAPLFAIGLRIRNYSDYSWESMKLLHHGHGIWYGNVTQDINLNLTGFEKGDELELTVDIPVIRIPSALGNNESWDWFLRLIYNIPVLKDMLLHDWLLPILAPYNLMFDEPAIFLRFQ